MGKAHGVQEQRQEGMRSSTSGGDKHCQSLGYCKFQVALCFLEMYQGSYWTDLAENLMDCQVLASHPANVSFEEVCCQSSSRHSIVDSKKCAGNAEVEFGCISSITVWALVSVCSLLVSYIGCMPSLVHFSQQFEAHCYQLPHLPWDKLTSICRALVAQP